jgi:transposase-like protein
MTNISYSGYRFPPEIIQQAIWLYVRFTLSFRDVEDLWRAVDSEGEVLDVLIQSRRNKRAALKLMRKLLKKYGFVPDKLNTDDLRSYAAAAHDLRISNRRERGRWRNNRAENSHKPTRQRERKMQGFKSVGSGHDRRQTGDRLSHGRRSFRGLLNEPSWHSSQSSQMPVRAPSTPSR